MRTPKIEALNRLINWLNAKSIDSKVQLNQKLVKLELDITPLGENAWLSGFIVADGNFYSQFKINSKGFAESIHHYVIIS